MDQSAPTEIVVFLRVEPGEGTIAALEESAQSIPLVAQVRLEIEDPERANAVEVLQEVTLTLTTAGGAIGAATMVLSKLKDLVGEAHGVKDAWVGTKEGPIPLQEAGGDAAT
jgi:phage baseplate assembly protein gpV